MLGGDSAHPWFNNFQRNPPRAIVLPIRFSIHLAAAQQLPLRPAVITQPRWSLASCPLVCGESPRE